jgi:MFS family permease
VVADRFDRRTVAGLAAMIDFLVVLALALATWLGAITLPLLFVLATLHGVARVFMAPAQSAIAPNIVPVEQLPKAIALGAMAFQGGSVAGPALGGLLFARAAAAPYCLGAVLLLAAALLLLSLPPVPAPPGNRHSHPLRQMAEGFSYVVRHRFLLGCATLDLFAVLFAGATALLPVYARDILTVDGHPVGADGLGLMRAAPAAGAAIVAVLLARWPLARNVGVKMLWSVAAYGAATLAFGLSRNFTLSLALLAGLGAADMVSVFIRTSLTQLHIPDTVRGRVSAITTITISASNELGEMESGLAVSLLGATGAVVFGGAAAILITALWAWLFPEIRRARTFTQPENLGERP